MNNQKLKRALKYIDSWLDLRYRKNEWPGFTVAISYKNKTIFNKSYGYANLETKEKLTPNHIFRIASQSKTFTAASVMQLFEKGKLKLDEPVAKYLNWIEKHKDKRFKKITIRQFLSHSTGIIRDGINSDYWQLMYPFPKREELKEIILRSHLIVDPDRQLKYSNIGYSLLGLVIEKASNKSYNDYVIENIVKPLKLVNTGPDYSEKINKTIVTGYSRPDIKKKRSAITNIKTNALSPATGFYSTSEELCRYYNALMIGSGKLLSDKSKKEMHKIYWKVKKSNEKDKYGLGLAIYKVDGKEYFGHGGNFPGHTTKTFYDPENKLVVSVFMNCIDGESGIAGRGVISIINYFQRNYSFKKTENLSKFEGRFMNLWSICDIISMGGKAISIYPDTWRLLEEIEILKYSGDNNLKIVSTHGFSSEGELIKFTFQNNKVKSIVYAGSTMLPEKKYLKNVKS